MAGTKAFRKVQLGAESTPGTAVAATTLWRGVGALNDGRELSFPEEDLGIFSGVDRSYIPKYVATISLDSVEATFEQLPYVLMAGVQSISSTADGSGSDRIWTFNIPTTTAPTYKTYTIETGDNQQAEEMEYSFVTSFTLEGNSGEAWMVSSEWQGRQVTDTTFTGALSIPSVTDMLFQKTSLFIDNVGGAFGTTQKTGTLLGASLEYSTNSIAKFVADGNLYFSFLQPTRPEITLKLTMEHDATSTAEKTNFRNETTRLIRLRCAGPAVTTAGTTYSTKTMIIDLVGKWSSFEPLGDQDGNSIIVAEFTGRYNATVGNAGKFIVVNELTNLP
jgi:hypothetical protein